MEESLQNGRQMNVPCKAMENCRLGIQQDLCGLSLSNGDRNSISNTSEADAVNDGLEPSELIILGSGSSTGVPSPLCLLRPTDPPCHVCHSAMEGPPELNKNYRCNPSLLISYRHGDETRYIQIDCGKNFKEQVLRWYVTHGIPRLDALILTHEHADAILGIDDIRGVQKYSSQNDIDPMPVFVTQHTMNSVDIKFPYLVDKSVKAGQEIRRVAQLDWRVFESSSSALLDVFGLQFTPLPVMHGEDYLSLGFLFGRRQRVAYISDVSRIPESTERLIAQSGELGPVDILILDCLYKHGPHNTHFCWEDSLAAIRRIRPRRAFFVGMTHEFEHKRDNAELAEWSRREGLDVQLAFDGMKISVCL